MLSSVLSKKSCAECRFCCSFRRCSLWETPIFDDDSVKKLSVPNEYGITAVFDNGRTVLEDKYKTDNPEEEVPCPFLDTEKGCVLSGEDKPFDCSIWPLRIMEKENELVIAFTPTCSALGKEPSQELIKLVTEDGLGDRIYKFAESHSCIIKPYKEGFPVIMSRNM